MIEMGWRRYDFAGVLVSHFCCPCFQNHSALTPHFFSFFLFRTARANKRPVRANKKKGVGWRESREKGVAIARSFVATAATGCNYFVTVILLRDGSPRGRNSLARHCRTAGPENGEILFPIDLATARRDDDYALT